MSMRSNPFEELERLLERMGRQFEEAAQSWDTGRPLGPLSGTFESMAVDLVDRDDAFVVTADLPGFERGDVDVRLADRTLRIDARREEETEETEETYIRRERRLRSANRSIQLPEAVDESAVTARMANGVLEVTLPKAEGGGGRAIEIE